MWKILLFFKGIIQFELNYKTSRDYSKSASNHDSYEIDMPFCLKQISSQNDCYNYTNLILKFLEEDDFDSLASSICHFSKYINDKSLKLSLSFSQYKLVSSTILQVFDPSKYPQLLRLTLPLLLNWTYVQSKGNEFFAQQQIHDYLISLILNHQCDQDLNNSIWNYRIYAIRILFNIIFDSPLMLKIFIESNSIKYIAEFFDYISSPIDDASYNEIYQMHASLPELMMLMSLVIEKSYVFQYIVEDCNIDTFISNCIYRLADHRVFDVTKYDYYVFSNYIIQKHNLFFFIERINFRDIFNGLYLFQNKDQKTNIHNILSVIIDIFKEIENYDDKSILQNIIPLNLEHLYKSICSQTDCEDDQMKSKSKHLFCNFIYHYFKLCDIPIDSNFDESVYDFLVDCLSDNVYKIRVSAINAFDSLTSSNSYNNTKLKELLKVKFFVLLNNFFYYDSPEIVESALRIIFNLTLAQDIDNIPKKIFDLLEMAESFKEIEEAMNSTEISELSLFYCNMILKKKEKAEESHIIGILIDPDDMIDMSKENDFDSFLFNQESINDDGYNYLF